MRTARSSLTRLLVTIAVAGLFSVLPLYPLPCLGATEKWQGVDESVVEKHAKEYGREAREPLINTGQGDLLLFVFLLAGAVGGFVAGYYWRILLEQRKTTREETGNTP